MKLNSLTKSMAAGAVALMVAGCGGGSGELVTPAAQTPPAVTPPAAVSGLQVTGTAATGAALAGAAVQVKCASGTGTATTSSTGGYTVTVEGGALPCLVKVTGTTAGGVAITLHSVTEAGTAGNGTMNAVANVTPITEMIVAQLTAALPADSFASFDLAGLDKQKLAQAATAVVNALQAAGIDLGSIDPLKSTLVPSLASDPHDSMLEQLGESVKPEALPLLVSQIASGASGNAATTLSDAMTAVSGGALASCPTALSGKFRFLDYFGKTYVGDIDYKAGTVAFGTGGSLAITTDSTKPCEFSAAGTVSGRDLAFQVVVAPTGLGSYKARATAPTPTAGIIGVMFPVQSHAVADVAGEWSYLQSGFMPGDGNVSIAGKMTLSADGKASFCDYDASFACVADTQMGPASLAARTDGGFDLNELAGSASRTVARFYGFRAPSGSLTVFATTNAAGNSGADVEQTIVVAGRIGKEQLPAQGATPKFWDVTLSALGGSVTPGAPVADSLTLLEVDSATGSVLRKRSSDGREDVMRYNAPLDGIRTREAGSFGGSSFRGVYGVQLPGTGLNVSWNKEPAGPTSPLIFSLSVQRP